MQCHNQLPFTMLVLRAKQLIRASADTKRHGGIVVQIGVISVESQAVHHFVRI
ncbi:Uncharacterised protein [Citrobacter amalonaticus]|nr:Uncharacterised protein [Citrobacter amalonaticus]